MGAYTIEDIELLREKSGISYQEAVAMLDYHSGNVARALVDLEKNGRLKNHTDSMNGKEVGNKMTQANGKKGETKEKALNLLQKLYRCRMKIHKGDTTILNFSSIFAAACLQFAPHMTIFGVIISMILGYRFSFTKLDEDFASENLEKMVRSAAQNAKSSVSSVVQSFSGDQAKSPAAEGRDKTTDNVKEKAAEEKQAVIDEKDPTDTGSMNEALKQQTREIEETMDSFFDSNPAATTYRNAYSATASSVPTLQIPVQTETRDGEVQIEDDRDGYSSVTIG